MKKIFILSEYSEQLLEVISDKFSVTGAIEDAFCAIIDSQKLHDISIQASIKKIVIFSENEKIEGDFDDFIMLPLNRVEISARLTRLSDTQAFQNGALSIDFEKSSVTLGGKQIHLTMLEYKLICLLAQNVGDTVSYETILSALWGSPLGSEIKSLRVFVNAIRTKLGAYGKDTIKTVSGKGYILLKA